MGTRFFTMENSPSKEVSTSCAAHIKIHNTRLRHDVNGWIFLWIKDDSPFERKSYFAKAPNENAFAKVGLRMSLLRLVNEFVKVGLW